MQRSVVRDTRHASRAKCAGSHAACAAARPERHPVFQRRPRHSRGLSRQGLCRESIQPFSQDSPDAPAGARLGRSGRISGTPGGCARGCLGDMDAPAGTERLQGNAGIHGHPEKNHEAVPATSVLGCCLGRGTHESGTRRERSVIVLAGHEIPARTVCTRCRPGPVSFRLTAIVCSFKGYGRAVKCRDGQRKPRSSRCPRWPKIGRVLSR